VGRDPKFRELRFISSISREGCSWVSIPGASGSVSSCPVTRSGRVRKNRTVLNNPESEKMVLTTRVNWYLTLNPSKYRQRAMLYGIMQMRYTTGYLNTKYNKRRTDSQDTENEWLRILTTIACWQSLLIPFPLAFLPRAGQHHLLGYNSCTNTKRRCQR